MDDPGDAVVIIVLFVVVGLVAWPRAQRWFRNGKSEPLVDPEQNITVNMIDGLPGLYETNYRPRHLARGRRHKTPPGVVVHRRPPREEPPRTNGD
jgi:hypothetical protein